MKKSSLSEQIALLHAKLVTSRTQRDIIALSREFGKLVDEALKKENALPRAGQDENIISCTITFTKKEVSDMDKTFKKHFILNGYIAHLIKRKSGKNGALYEIRYRRNGYDISASSTDLAEAKRKFLEKTRPEEIGNHQKGTRNQKQLFPLTFHSFATYYFEKFRKFKVAEQTLKNDLSRYNKYLRPHFQEMLITKITPPNCKELLDRVKDEGKGKTADELYSLMNAIFNSARAHKIIVDNPLATVLHIQHDREEGKALTPDQESKLLAWMQSNACDCAIELALCLFCGLRSNEMENQQYPPTTVDGNFIKAVNSKRHFKDKTKIEFKYIPICNRLRPFLKDGIQIKHTAKITLRRLKTVLPQNTLKDLRTTFYTKCQTLGVAEVALKSFMGHSFGKLGNAYSDLSKQKDYLLNEGEKLNDW